MSIMNVVSTTIPGLGAIYVQEGPPPAITFVFKNSTDAQVCKKGVMETVKKIAMEKIDQAQPGSLEVWTADITAGKNLSAETDSTRVLSYTPRYSKTLDQPMTTALELLEWLGDAMISKCGPCPSYIVEVHKIEPVAKPQFLPKSALLP